MNPLLACAIPEPAGLPLPCPPWAGRPGRPGPPAAVSPGEKEPLSPWGPTLPQAPSPHTGLLGQTALPGWTTPLLGSPCPQPWCLCLEVALPWLAEAYGCSLVRSGPGSRHTPCCDLLHGSRICSAPHLCVFRSETDRASESIAPQKVCAGKVETRLWPHHLG